MGLLYLFPASSDESDYVEKRGTATLVHTYGLPLSFWMAYLVSVSLVFIMGLIIWQPLLRMLENSDPINQTLAYATFLTMIGVPLVGLGFFFFRKTLIKENDQLTVVIKVFGLPLRRKKIKLRPNDGLVIEHFLDSPNMARLHDHPDFERFKNKGYFELFAYDVQGKKTQIDRSGRKKDLTYLKQILF